MPKKVESHLQLRIQRWIRQEYPSCWMMKVHGGPFQPVGVPDLIGIVYGRMFAFEVKRPGEEPTVIQKRTLDALRNAGAIVGVVRSPGEALDLLKANLGPWRMS